MMEKGKAEIRRRKRDYARLYRKRIGPEYFRKLTRETYYRHQEEYQQRGRERNFQLKLSVIGHYSGGDNRCRHCGESRLACLSIDHMNGLGTKNRRALHRSGTPFYQWLKIQN